jgi:hypothetical protein
MFMVPALITLFVSLFDSPEPHSIWSDTVQSTATGG